MEEEEEEVAKLYEAIKNHIIQLECEGPSIITTEDEYPFCAVGLVHCLVY